MGLTNRRKIFVEEYLKTWNASEAARRAGYKHPGVTGCKLLKNAEIAEAVERNLSELKATKPDVAIRRKMSTARTVYLIREKHGLVKIGKAADFERRFEILSQQTPYDLEIVDVIQSEAASKIEGELHKRYAEYRVRGEWFSLDGKLDEVREWAYRLKDMHSSRLI